MNQINEEWRPVVGYEGLYVVSNLGRVKSLPRGKQWPYRQTHNNILTQTAKSGGYLTVTLSKGGKAETALVHRLVATAFIQNPLFLPCVNHKDENKLNNLVENLEWCTVEYNCNYGTARKRQIESRLANPANDAVRKAVGEKNSRSVRQLSRDGQLIAVYKSLAEASEKTGINISTIIRHCKGRISGSVRKYFFEYA